jgi:hypothetical protein
MSLIVNMDKLDTELPQHEALKSVDALITTMV